MVEAAVVVAVLVVDIFGGRKDGWMDEGSFECFKVPRLDICNECDEVNETSLLNEAGRGFLQE